jgi:predicted Rossmann fold nucleotide-binding protein DprA/Smf involved in DNA uptake
MYTIKACIGNQELLKLPKTAFLCSRKVPANVVLKCYDWAIKQRDAGKCIISGFHSQLEKDVFYYLMKGKQPIIVVLARGLKQRFDPEIQKVLAEGRLLIISPFEKKITRVTQQTSVTRNRLMVQLADEVVVGFTSDEGNLSHLIKPLLSEKIIFL